jgi:hypothetical protein
MSDTKTSGHEALVNMHKVLLEALRHREQDIFRYLAILAPALGGFIWLMKSVQKSGADSDSVSELVFVLGTLGILLLLFFGAAYSLALGYNYRYVVFQLAKLESALEIDSCMLERWPKTTKKFCDNYGFWCVPPGIIKVFWLAFLSSILFVTISALVLIESCGKAQMSLVAGFGLIVVAGCLPFYYGWKFRKLCEEEKKGSVWGKYEVPLADTAQKDETQE